MKIIKCEWCNHNYDLDKVDSCPRCGGTNSNLDDFIIKKPKLTTNNSFNNLKKSSDTNIKNKSIKKFITIAIFICFLVFIIESIFGMFFYVFEEISDNLKVFHHRYFYIENPKYIEVGNGKVYIDSLFLSEDDFREYDKTLDIKLNLIVDSKDFEEHEIDLYLYQGEDKYSFSDVSCYHNKSNITLDNLFKYSGMFEFSGETTISFNSNDDLFDFDKVEIKIDGESYKFSLKPHLIQRKDYGDLDDVDYYVAGKISFGDGNLFYIDGLRIIEFINSTSVRINFSSQIEDFSCKDLKMFLRDTDGILHRIDFGSSSYGKLSEISELLTYNIEDEEIYFDVWTMQKDFEALLFEIDGEVFDISISPMR